MVNKLCNLKSQRQPTRIAREESRESRNFAIKHDVVVQYLVAILTDFKTMLPLYGDVEYERDKATILTRFAHEGLSFATKTLPCFFDSVLNYLETGVSVYPSFKLGRGGYPVFLRQLTKQIYEQPDEASTATYMKCLYQLCVAFKKLKGPYAQGVIRDQLADFIKVDRELPLFEEPNEFQERTLLKAEKLIARVIRGLNPFDREQSELFTPRPGPGATNSPTEPHERFRPHVLYTHLHKEFPLEEWYQPLNRHPQFNRWDLRVGKTVLPVLKTRKAPTARFKFVHKTYGKPRGICIEELEMQWLQQGLRKALYDRAETHPLTKGKVNFRQQDVNQALALQASSDRLLATIDMSSASDRISRPLVERLFRSNKELLKALLLLSTRTVELPRAPGIPRTISVNKFAPMGSALCFPVMGLVHWALISALIHLDSPPHVKIPVYVYGDDIIVPSEHAQTVYDGLPQFGMKLNVEKSFVKSGFRESCGTHAYNGVDITPTRFKSVVKFPPVNEDFVSALHNEGDLFEKGFFETASLIRRSIQHFPAFGAKNLPKVRKKSPLLGWIRENGDALSSLNVRERWNNGHSMLLKSVRVLEPRLGPPYELSDVEGYLRQQLSNTDDSRSMGGSPDGLQIRRKWLPDSDLEVMHPIRLRILRMFNLKG